MRVSHICSNYDNFFNNLMDKQLENGLELKVFYFRSKNRGYPEKQNDYVDVRLNYSNFDRFFFKRKQKKVLKDYENLYTNQKFDIVHAHTLFSNGYIAREINKKRNIPYIVAVRDMDINVFFKYRINLRKIGLDILENASKIIFISESYKNILLENYIPPKKHKKILDKSIVIPNGIDDYFIENQFLNNGVSDKKIKLITVGYVCKRKNQKLVVEAAKKLIKKGYEIEYKVIGKSLNDRLLTEIKKNKFVKYIQYLPKDKLINEYRDSDIFVMPSITETFGLTYIEAISQGLPVIYSGNQGISSYFNEGEVGYSTSDTDSDDLLKKIECIHRNYHKITNGINQKIEIFNWEGVSANYIKLYSEVINEDRNK